MNLAAASSQIVKSSIAGILDFAFAWRCVVCHSEQEAGRQGSFCADCHTALTREIPNSCEKCAAEVGQFVSTENGCVHCRNRRLRFNSVVCLGMYDETMRRAILASKWSHSSVGLRTLAKLLATEQEEKLQDLQVDLLIPIPQPWTTRLTRPFNSATIVAEEVSRAAAAKIDRHILFRKGRVRPQKRVAVQHRFANQRGAFRVQDAHVIKDKRILLADDVLTTGATCTEAASELKKAGAAEVHVAVVARVLGTG